MKPSILLTFGLALHASAQGFHERAPTRYSETREENAATALNRRLEKGETALPAEGESGRLAALLNALKIPASSQTLVTSKTSFHRQLISPANPRALYFGPDAYVGWVRGAPVLEVAVGDPKLGLVFYTLAQDPAKPPRLMRNDSCLSCHNSPRTGDEPGLVLRSIFPDTTGEPIAPAGETDVTTFTPFEKRWGGWLVTGRFNAPHRGNGHAVQDDVGEWRIQPRRAADLSAFASDFDAGRFLKPGSDIAALLALEQQATVHNLLIRASLQVRCLLEVDREINAMLNKSGPREQSTRIMKGLAEEIVAALLLKGEPDMASAQAAPDPEFAADFPAQSPQDSAGLRLGKFDMKRGLFELPLSPMIHSPAFDVLPAPLRTMVLNRLHEALEGGRMPEGVAALDETRRRQLHEHLRMTLKDYSRISKKNQDTPDINATRKAP